MKRYPMRNATIAAIVSPPIHPRTSQTEIPWRTASAAPAVPATVPDPAAMIILSPVDSFGLAGAGGSGMLVAMAPTFSRRASIGSFPAFSASRSAMPLVPPFHALTQPVKSPASANRFRFFHCQNATQTSGCLSSCEATDGLITAGRPVRRSRAA